MKIELSDEEMIFLCCMFEHNLLHIASLIGEGVEEIQETEEGSIEEEPIIEKLDKLKDIYIASFELYMRRVHLKGGDKDFVMLNYDKALGFYEELIYRGE